jgi:alpha 1,3-glucosidase
MNEPSVFNAEMRTFPLQNIHKREDGTWILHRDVHNAYGGMHQKTTWQGLLARNSHKQRPFVLTRSFFLG